MRFLSKYYNKITFNTFQLSVPVAVNITWDNNATCKACPFIFARSYSCPTNWWPGCIHDLPLYDTLYIINLQCTFSVGVMVSSFIQISTRSATINKPKVQIEGNCWAWNGFVYGYFAFANFALIFFYNIFSWPLIAKPQNIITLRKVDQ